MIEKISKEDKPDSMLLSVVIASAAPVDKLQSSLITLVKQTEGKSVEIMASVCCDESALQELVVEFPNVKFTAFSSNTPLPQLWGAGISHSNGEIVAITDSTCLFAENWIQAIVSAHQSPHPVIGGAVEMAKLKSRVDWAAYFCEYGQFMPPLTAGVVHEAPGNNVSFKRWALDNGQEFVRNGFWKTYHCRKLQEDGHQLLSEPSILVYYNKFFDLLPFLIRRFHHGRCFAGMRIKQITLLMRAVYILGSPLLFFIFLARTIKTFLHKKRLLKEFILAFPIIVLAIGMWAFGEFCGYLSGEGKSCSYIF